MENITTQQYLDYYKEPSKIFVFDTETTGISSDDEIVQLSITDGNGKELFNELIKPTKHTSWPEAEAITGIGPNEVSDAKTLGDYYADIEKMLYSANVIIGYNVNFDVTKLLKAGIIFPQQLEIIDLMQLVAPMIGQWNPRYGNYKWVKLIDCAKYFNYPEENDNDFHDSLYDTKVTAYCFKKYAEMCANGEVQKIIERRNKQQ